MGLAFQVGASASTELFYLFAPFMKTMLPQGAAGGIYAMAIIVLLAPLGWFVGLGSAFVAGRILLPKDGRNWAVVLSSTASIAILLAVSELIPMRSEDFGNLISKGEFQDAAKLVQSPGFSDAHASTEEQGTLSIVVCDGLVDTTYEERAPIIDALLKRPVLDLSAKPWYHHPIQCVLEKTKKDEDLARRIMNHPAFEPDFSGLASLLELGSYSLVYETLQHHPKLKSFLAKNISTTHEDGRTLYFIAKANSDMKVFGYLISHALTNPEFHPNPWIGGTSLLSTLCLEPIYHSYVAFLLKNPALVVEEQDISWCQSHPAIAQIRERLRRQTPNPEP